MKVCIYLRKSRADRDHSDMPLEAVLKNHEALLLAFAGKLNLDIADIKKEVVSGESLARRPEMLKLLEEVEDGFYDAVLVKDFDRLGRGSMMEQGLIIEAFRKSGTKIITPEKTYDLENEFDEEYIDLSAFFARKELKMITKRLHSGRMKSVSDGNYISPYAPYGYDKNHKTLTVNDWEKPVVDLIFHLYVNQGYGDTRIARYLTDHGIPNKHGKAHWDKTTIRNMIQNPVYIGKITWNKREYRYEGNGKRTSRFVNKSQWKIYEGRHEAIIDDTLFQKAQQIAEKGCIPHLHMTKPVRNPMAAMIKCGSCGATMTIRTARGKADTLRCYKHCGASMSSYLSLVEERIIDLLAQRLSDLEIPFQYMESEKKADSEYPVLLHSLENCMSQKNRLKVQIDNLHDLLEQGVYSRETFLERSKKVAENLHLVEDRIDTVKKQLSHFNALSQDNDLNHDANNLPPLKGIREFIKTVYWRLDPKNKNEFLRNIVDTILYSKPTGTKKDGFVLDIILKE